MKKYELHLKEFQQNEMTGKIFPISVIFEDKPSKGELISLGKDTLVIMDITHTPGATRRGFNIDQLVGITKIIVQYR